MKKFFNQLFKLVFCIIFIFSAFFFISERDAYHPQEILPYVGSIAEPFREKGVHITAKTYDVRDSKAYLDRDLLQVGFQPIQITIQNNTDQAYLLSNQGVGIPTAETNQVARYVTRAAIPRAIGFKVAGFVFWPFLIPGTIDSIITCKSHIKMKRDYHAKSIKDEEEHLPPYSTLHRVIFLPTNQKFEEFTLHLKNQKTHRFSPFQVKIAIK
ncbi:MAG: hypothetical protein KR126chlam3_00739 [Chlamydiae bacterium]|nr:hypothetical protein [Chlamydiota bacterium]